MTSELTSIQQQVGTPFSLLRDRHRDAVANLLPSAQAVATRACGRYEVAMSPGSMPAYSKPAPRQRSLSRGSRMGFCPSTSERI